MVSGSVVYVVQSGSGKWVPVILDPERTALEGWNVWIALDDGHFTQERAEEVAKSYGRLTFL